MTKIEQSDVKLGIPPAFSERCAVRCVESKFGLNKNQSPMITNSWELVGWFDESGQLQTSMKRGNMTYQLAGLKVRASYHTLNGKALVFYADFYKSATGEELTEIDETNPNVEYLDGLIMQAIVTGKMEQFRKQLTDEEKEQLKKEGKPQLGAPILDEDGKPIEVPSLNVQRFLKKFSGEIPN